MRRKSLLFLLSVSFLAFASAASEVRLVVNTENRIKSITKEKLSRIYLGKRTLWSDGARIRPTLLDGGTGATERFVSSYLGMKLSTFRRIWRQKLFSGGGVPPKKFKTQSGLLDFVAREKASIGFIIEGELPEGVRLLEVE